MACINSLIKVTFESVSLLARRIFVLNKFSLKTRSFKMKLIDDNSSYKALFSHSTENLNHFEKAIATYYPL